MLTHFITQEKKKVKDYFRNYVRDQDQDFKWDLLMNEMETETVQMARLE